MGKNKLQKFEDMETFPHVFQYPYGVLQTEGFPLKGNWGKDVFKNDNPIVLELGCGRGEYTVGLGRLFPEKNFIGIDIKGARMWRGAKESLEEGLSNVAFLRTNIELLSSFFATGEVAEIWLTFPDPQMKKVNKRLTSTRFMHLYRQILNQQGIVHLKTDSPFMYQYTCQMIKVNNLPVLVDTNDLYQSDLADKIRSIKTYYEEQWLERGLTIKYLQFVNSGNMPLIEPEIEIELDAHRSYNRSKRSGKTQAY